MTDYLARSNLRQEGFILTHSSKVIKAEKEEWKTPYSYGGRNMGPFVHILLIQESRETQEVGSAYEP